MKGKEDVWARVERFRGQYPELLARLPVDVLTVV